MDDVITSKKDLTPCLVRFRLPGKSRVASRTTAQGHGDWPEADGNPGSHRERQAECLA